MERSEPSLVPEWLKNGGSITGGGNSNIQFTSSTLHSDNHSEPRHARNRLSGESDHDVGRTSALEGTTSAYFRRNSTSNGSADSRSYSSFSKGNRDRNREKDINGFHDREKYVLTDHRKRDYSDSLDNMLPSMFDRDVLRHSQSMITGKRGDTWPRKVISDSSATNKSNQSGDNGLHSGVSTGIGTKSSFERDFPVLGSEERQVGSDIGTITSPGLSTGVQSLPVGTSAFTSGDGWTSALADVPVGMGSSGAGVAVASQFVSASSTSVAPTTTTGLNMAETVAQGPSHARTPPLLNIGTQRLEELAIKQSRQLIPLVTTSTPKTLVVSPSEKSKSKVGQQQHPSLSLNYTRGSGTSRSDSLKVSNESRLQILKPSRELNGISLITKDNLSPTNGSSKTVSSPLSVTASAAVSAPFRRSGNSPNFATAERNQTPFRITIEKRPTAQAQSRNDFFNLLKKKSTMNSPSASNTGHAVSPSFSDKSDELCREDASSLDNLQDGSVPLSEPVADLPSDNSSEETHDRDAYVGSQQCSTNGDRHTSADAFLYPDEEEAAFLRSLGWDENAGDDEGLTEEEIRAFFEEYMKLKPSTKLFHRLQSVVPLNSHNGTSDGASSESSSTYSN